MLQILHYILFVLITGYSMYVVFHVLYSRYRFITLGEPMLEKKNTKARLKEIWVNVFAQKKLLKDKKSGIMHIVMFYGFIIVQFGAVELIIKGLSLGWHVPLGSAYKYFTLSQEITVFLILAAVTYAFYRRYVEKLKRLKRGLKAGIVLVFISTLMLSELLSLGFESVLLNHEPSMFTPFSSLVIMGFSGMNVVAAEALFYAFWWIHLLILLSFAVYVPQSKHAHLIFAPINIYFKKLDSPGKLSTIDLEDEDAEEFGVGRIEKFRQDQLLDLYACVECGRCTNVCPASTTGKTLSPMNLIVKMRDHLTEKGASITSRTPWMPAAFLSKTTANQLAAAGSPDTFEQNLIGDVITEEELWACTTCRNCEDQCPVANEHVDMIVDMRRYLVLTEGKSPSEVTRTYQNIERQGNPWGLSRKERIKWREGLEEIIQTVNELKEFDILFYVGSMGTYDKRNVDVAKATAKLMNLAGVKFAILGNDEGNSGDTARRTGNEFLFQQLASETIAVFQKYNVQKIVTCDPHAYNTFKNEYPDFGLEAEVIHHTELLAELVKEGRLKPTKEVNESITYHDSCYLGRYNEVYAPPRDILKAIPGVQYLEIKRSKENSMCCGAGGGLMWMEETEGTRVNIKRTEQLLEVNPSVISSACPYCLTMMGDGTKAKDMEEQVRTMDVAEILLQSVQ